MHRHVRRIGDELAFASKIAQEKSSRSLMFTEEAVFCSVDAHLLGDGHEEIVEHFQQHRIGLGAERVLRAAWAFARSARTWLCRVISARQPGSTTIVWCGSMISAGPSPSRRASGSRADRRAHRAMRLARRSASCARGFGRSAERLRRVAGSFGRSASPTASTESASIDQRRRAIDEAETRRMHLVERRLRSRAMTVFVAPLQLDRQSSAMSVPAFCRCRLRVHADALPGDALRGACRVQRACADARQACAIAASAAHRAACLNALLPRCARAVGEPHAIGRQHPTTAVDEARAACRAHRRRGRHAGRRRRRNNSAHSRVTS